MRIIVIIVTIIRDFQDLYKIITVIIVYDLQFFSLKS